MFASKSLSLHLARGVVGICALSGAVRLEEASPWTAMALVVCALVALRGCPMCWTMGLVQTVVATVRGKRATGACVDGSCSIRCGLDR